MHISIGRGYKFKHIYFEWHNYLGPVFLRRKDDEQKPQQLRPMRDYQALGKWQALAKEQREKFRVY